MGQGVSQLAGFRVIRQVLQRVMGSRTGQGSRGHALFTVPVAGNPVVQQLFFKSAENAKHGGTRALNQLPEATVFRRTMTANPALVLQCL